MKPGDLSAISCLESNCLGHCEWPMFCFLYPIEEPWTQVELRKCHPAQGLRDARIMSTLGGNWEVALALNSILG